MLTPFSLVHFSSPFPPALLFKEVQVTILFKELQVTETGFWLTDYLSLYICIYICMHTHTYRTTEMPLTFSSTAPPRGIWLGRGPFQISHISVPDPQPHGWGLPSSILWSGCFTCVTPLIQCCSYLLFWQICRQCDCQWFHLYFWSPEEMDRLLFEQLLLRRQTFFNQINTYFITSLV